MEEEKKMGSQIIGSGSANYDVQTMLLSSNFDDKAFTTTSIVEGKIAAGVPFNLLLVYIPAHLI